MTALVLASGSPVRAKLLRAAGISFVVEPAKIDEEIVRESLVREGATAREIAIALAELKASRVSLAHPDALVIGADQILSFAGEIVSKSEDLAAARGLLSRLSGKTHQLVSAVVLARGGAIVWRHVETVDMRMRTLSAVFLDSYFAAAGERILGSVGAYEFEETGVQLFAGYSGDYFSILGLPLLPLLSALRELGAIAT